MMRTASLTDTLGATGAFICLDCGKCTANCPVALLKPGVSPRGLVSKAVRGDLKALWSDPLLWSCLTCGMCQQRCIGDVNFVEFIRRLRLEAIRQGVHPVLSHDGALQAAMRLMARPGASQRRIEWLAEHPAKKGEQETVVYFTGCLPYYDVLLADIKADPLNIARSTMRLLRAAGCDPVVMPDERCCGADLLWAGDEASFAKLAEHNLREIGKTDAKTVVTACAECYHTLHSEYPRFVGKLGFEVVHTSLFLANALATGKLDLGKRAGAIHELPVVTYHDPCRLGRLSGVYDEPRRLIESVPGLKLVEMRQSRHTALCCGTTNWMECTSVSRSIQFERLSQAKAAGAQTLVTACPKCKIHLTCAQRNKDAGELANVRILDINELLSDSVAGGL